MEYFPSDVSNFLGRSNYFQNWSELFLLGVGHCWYMCFTHMLQSTGRVFFGQSRISSSRGKDNGGRRLWRALNATTENWGGQWKRGFWRVLRQIFGVGLPSTHPLYIWAESQMFPFSRIPLWRAVYAATEDCWWGQWRVGGRLGRSHSGSSGGLQALEHHQHLSCISTPALKAPRPEMAQCH